MPQSSSAPSRTLLGVRRATAWQGHGLTEVFDVVVNVVDVLGPAPNVVDVLEPPPPPTVDEKPNALVPALPPGLPCAPPVLPTRPGRGLVWPPTAPPLAPPPAPAPPPIVPNSRSPFAIKNARTTSWSLDRAIASGISPAAAWFVFTRILAAWARPAPMAPFCSLLAFGNRPTIVLSVAGSETARSRMAVIMSGPPFGYCCRI